MFGVVERTKKKTKSEDFRAACESQGYHFEEPKTFRCRLFGCDLPPANVLQETVTDWDEQGRPIAAWGKAGNVECRRCGRSVNPFESDYPMCELGVVP